MQPLTPPEGEDPGKVVDSDVLASRRARRAEEPDDAPYRERAQQAEQAVVSLERRLADAESRLATAQGERAELAQQVAASERALRNARQREFAEQQLRVEAEGEAGAARREAEEQVSRLRADLRQANVRADELRAELEHARRAVAEALEGAALAEAQARRAATPGREGVERELGELQALADGLEVELASERMARADAERALADERERAQAEVTLLQHEIDRRAQVHEAITAQLSELRREFEAVRRAAHEQPGAEHAAVIAEIAATTARLRDALRELKEQKAAAEARVLELEAALDGERGRAQALERDAAERAQELRTVVERQQAELAAVRSEAHRHRLALEAAEASAQDARARAVELAGQLDEERRTAAAGAVDRRAAFAAEREAVRAEVEQAQAAMRAELGVQRQAFEAQTEAVEGAISLLRGRLAAAATELQAELEAERAARVEAERRAETAGSALDDASSRLAERAGSVERAEAAAAEAVRRQDEARAALDAERERVLEQLRGAESALAEAQEQAAAERVRAAAAEQELRVERERAASAEARAQALAEDVDRARGAAQQTAADAVAEARRMAVDAVAEAQRVAAEAIAAREAAAADLQARAGLEQELRDALGALRGELGETESGIDAAGSLVADLLGIVQALRDGFTREVAALAAEREAGVAAERERFAMELRAMEERVSGLRAQLGAATEELRAELEAERTRRWVAEEELARERDRVVALGGAEGPGDGDQAELHDALRRSESALERSREAEAVLREELAARDAELEALRTGADLDPSPGSAPPAGPVLASGALPGADHPALGGRPGAPAAPSTPEELESVILDLAKAAQRLRAERGEPSEPALPAGLSGPLDAPAPPRAYPDDELLHGATPEAVEDEHAEADLEAVEAEPEPEPEPGPVPPRPMHLLPSRRTAVELSSRTSWLGPALTRLGAEDPGAAARLLLAFLPVQGLRLKRPVTYGLRVGEGPGVTVQAGRRTVRTAAAGEDDVRVPVTAAGDVASLAPLVAGGAWRQLPGATVTGRARKLRRVLRAMRDEVGLAELAASGAAPRVDDLLALLAVAVPSGQVTETRRAVAFVPEAGGEGATLTLAPGLPPTCAVPVEDADATVLVPEGELLSVLAGLTPAQVRGDVAAATAVLHAVDAAQGWR